MTSQNCGKDLEAQMGEWQPIETAPKDGTPVLIYCPNEKEWTMLVAERSYSSWYVHGNEIYSDMTGVEPDPTHWMPLPEPPTLADAQTALEAIAELRALRADAERYRFLRDAADNRSGSPFIARRTAFGVSAWTDTHADAAIDSAIAATTP